MQFNEFLALYSIAIGLASLAILLGLAVLFNIVILRRIKGVAKEGARATMPNVQGPMEVTVLRCTKCGQSMTRPFKPGDYVGKVTTDEVCPNDGASMTIYSIYLERTRPK